MIQDVSGEEGLFAGLTIEDSEFGGTAAEPGPEPGGVIERKVLSNEAGADAGKDVAHGTNLIF